jgi:zinc protease
MPSDSTPVERATVGQRTLDNGLQVVWEEDHRQPLVAIEARIKGGLRGEGPYVGTGITHAIEHMLFKGTTSRPAGTLDQEVRRYGGSINASTSFDSTGVSLFVESRYLRDALGLLADILQHAVFDEAEFAKERAVIISEIQMNLDDPDRRLQHLFWGRHFLEHPYRHPILGYQPLLEQLAVNDLRSFYAAQYQPQHVVLSCVGNLEGATFGETAKEVFGSWPRGRTDPTQQLVPAEPPTASAKEATAELPVQLAYVMLGVTSTRLADPDLYPLDVLASIVGHGRSSRLYERLVRQQRLVYAVDAWNYTPYDLGVFGISLRTDADKVAAAKAAALGVLSEIQRDGVTDEELRKAKTQVTADYFFGLQTVESRASDLANSLAATGDPLFSRRYVEGIDRVTADAVREAARRYYEPAKVTTAVIRPPADVPAGTTVAPPGPMPVSKTALGNGTTLLMGVDRTLPIAAIVVAFRGGVRVETEEHQGLSNLVAQLLAKGTKRRSASEIAAEVEGMGGALEPFSGRDGFGLMLQLLAQDVDDGLALVHDLVTQSEFSESELEIQRQLIIKQLEAQDDEIFDVGGRLLRRTLFGQHPYRFHPLGAKETLRQLSRADCVAFAAQWVVPSNTVIAVFGDVDAAAVERRIEALFGRLRPGANGWPVRLDTAPLQATQRAAQTMPKEQALVMLGFRGTTQTADDRHALDVMTAALSGMSGRLFQAVREQHGLSYTLGAVHVPGWDPGYLLIYAATRPEEEGKVTEALEQQLELAASKGFSDEEVELAKRYLTGEHRLELQHLAGLAKRSAVDELFGLGFDAWLTYERQIAAVTATEVHEVAKRYLTVGRHAQVVISPNGHPDTTSHVGH